MSTLGRVRALKKPIAECEFRCVRPFSPLFVDSVTAIDWEPTWEGHGDAAAEEPFVPSRKVGHGETKRERAKSPSLRTSRKSTEDVRICATQPCYS